MLADIQEDDLALLLVDAISYQELIVIRLELLDPDVSERACFPISHKWVLENRRLRLV